MNTDIKFRFVTRTFSEDYRVFGDGGRKTYSDIEEFEPLRRKFAIIPEDGACAVLYQSHDDGNIFLVVSGMNRGICDFANRPVRFSFCQIFADKNKSQAWSAFLKITKNWHDAELTLQRLIKNGENIDFNQAEFIAWLQNDYRYVAEFTECNENEALTLSDSDYWPVHGTMLRWCKNDEKKLSCIRVNNDDDSVKSIMMNLMRPKTASQHEKRTGKFRGLIKRFLK